MESWITPGRIDQVANSNQCPVTELAHLDCESAEELQAAEPQPLGNDVQLNHHTGQGQLCWFPTE